MTATPCFITKPEETEKLVWNNLCTQNLAKYVHDLITAHKNSQKRVKPEDRKKKVIGVVARGCTTRSLIIHLQERQYGRDEVCIIGVPCDGYVDGKGFKVAIGGAELLGVGEAVDVELDRVGAALVAGVELLRGFDVDAVHGAAGAQQQLLRAAARQQDEQEDGSAGNDAVDGEAEHGTILGEGSARRSPRQDEAGGGQDRGSAAGV